MSELKECLLICALGSEGSDARKRAENLMKFLVKPALSAMFNVQCVCDITKNSMITKRTLESVLETDLLIADLTDGNPNVLYELALRHTQGSPFIQIRQQGSKLPFDVQDIETVEYDFSDPNNLESAKIRLASIAATTMQFENPAIEAINRVKLRSNRGAKSFSTDFFSEFIAANSIEITKNQQERYLGHYNVYAFSKWAADFETGPILCSPTEISYADGCLKWKRESYKEGNWTGIFLVSSSGEIILIERQDDEKTSFQFSLFLRAEECPSEHIYGINITYVYKPAKFRMRTIVMERIATKGTPRTVFQENLNPKVIKHLVNMQGATLDKLRSKAGDLVETLMIHINSSSE